MAARGWCHFSRGGRPHRGPLRFGPQRPASGAAAVGGGHGPRCRRPCAGRSDAHRVAGRPLRAQLPAHRPAEGGRGQGGRGHECGLCRAPQGPAGAGHPDRGGGGHCRAVRARLDVRSRAADAQVGPHGALQPAGHRPLHGRILCTCAVGAGGHQERRQRQCHQQLRAAGGAGQEQQAARCQRPGRGAGGGLAVAVRLRPACQRHPHGAPARSGRDPLPHRRCAAPGVPAAAGRDECDGVAHQAAGPHGRGGAPPSAGWPHQDAQAGGGRCAGRRGGDAPVDPAHRVRREAGDAHLRPRVDRQGSGGAGFRAARCTALGIAHPPAPRHRAGDRPDRFRARPPPSTPRSNGWRPKRST